MSAPEPGPSGAALAALFLAMLVAAPAARANDLTDLKDDFDSLETGESAVPIAGYDAVNGWVVGGAGFMYSDRQPGINAGLFFVSNFGDFNSATLNYEQRGTDAWYFGLHLLVEQAYDYYFGEGDLTSPLNPLVVHQHHYEAKPAVRYRLLRHFSAGVFIDYRARQEVGSQLFPNEASGAPGLHLDWDTRDKYINTRKGDFFQLEVYGRPGEDYFSQETLDLRRYIRLSRVWTLASHVSADLSQGTPSYLREFRLGGLDLLRGYQGNRFRGDELLVDQEELRLIVKKWISVNLSVDAGDIGEGSFHQLKASGQVGVRVGIPPDWTQKIRVDYGVGSDQSTWDVQFGEVF